jgi:MFS family permease
MLPMTVEPPATSGTSPGAPPATPEPATRLRGGLLRHHDFRQLFIGDTLSQVGTQFTTLAIPVLAVKVLDAGAFQMGLLGTAEFFAFLVIGLPAGAWVDRWRKKRVLMANDLLRAVALGSLPLAWAFDVLSFPQMLLVALVVGCCTVFFDVAYQSYLPDIVEPEHIGEGNAKLQAVQSIAMIGGPAAAGGLVKLIGAPLTVGLDALSFVWSATWVRRIRHVDSPPPREERRPLAVEVREGLSFVVRHPLLWRITACTSLSNLFSSIAGAMLVLYGLRLGLDPAELGVGFGVGAVGGLTAALLVTRITTWVGEGRIIPLSTLVWMPAGFLMPLAGTVIDPLVALVGSSLLTTFGVVLYNVAQVSFRQRLCPRPMLGRMNASIRFLVWGTMPIGSFIGGILGHQLGLRSVFWIEAFGAILAALPVWFSPLIKMRELPRELDLLSEPA